MSHTFSVAPVARAKGLLKSATFRDVLDHPARSTHGSLGGGVNSSTLVVTLGNPFVDTIHAAFNDHRSLALSPDDVWTVITQGFATHVRENAEELRSKFVSHQGQVRLHVETDFKRTDPNAPWDRFLTQFSGMIAGHIGEETRNLLVSAYTTTGPIEQSVSEIVLMGAMGAYFKYSVGTLCGIPEVTLLGTAVDWRTVRQRAQALAQYGLDWWLKELDPVLEQFVKAAEGNPDTRFWNSIYKLHNESGGPFVSGWILALFPYMEGYVRNGNDIARDAAGKYVRKMQRSTVLAWEAGRSRVKNGDFPPGTTNVPFVWTDNGVETPMEFHGGVLAVGQDEETQTLRPAMGWLVRDPATPKPPTTRDQYRDFY